MAGTSGNVTPETGAARDAETEDLLSSRPPRQVTIYDAVAGRAGLKGFLSQEQRHSENVLPVTPEEVLLGRATIPKDLMDQAYDASGTLPDSIKLPESEMLKAIHAYASDFYDSAAEEQGKYDFRSLDETALIAVGILLEEAVREALGQNGDMVFVEPKGLEHGLDETKMTKYQVKGRVKPARPSNVDPDEDSLQEDESPAKKQRR